MDEVVVGIDVAKDKLDVGVRPSGERFVVSRNAAGLEELNDRLGKLGVAVVGLEATGGYETIVAASLSAAGLPVVVVNPAKGSRLRPRAHASGPRRTRSTPPSSPISSKRPSPRFVRCRTRRRVSWAISSPDAARSWR